MWVRIYIVILLVGPLLYEVLISFRVSFLFGFLDINQDKLHHFANLCCVIWYIIVVLRFLYQKDKYTSGSWPFEVISSVDEAIAWV